MKKVGACIVLAAYAMGTNLEKEKSTLEINWENSKGETKTFKINDIEKEFNPDEIKAKTFLQGDLTTGAFGAKHRFSSRQVSKSKSKSRSKSRGVFKAGRGERSLSGRSRGSLSQRREARASRSRSESGRRVYRAGRSLAGASKSAGRRELSNYNAHEFRSSSKTESHIQGAQNLEFCGIQLESTGHGYGYGDECGKTRRNVCGTNYGEECGSGYGKTRRNLCGSGRRHHKNKDVCEFSKSKSLSCGRQPVIVEERPIHIVKKIHVPRKKQNHRYHNDHYNHKRSCSRDNLLKASKDCDKNLKTVNIEDLEKLLKLNKEKRNAHLQQNAQLCKNGEKNQDSNYCKDENALARFNAKQRELSCENTNKFKKARQNNKANKRNNQHARRHSVEQQKSHNLMNINHKANENLCLNENAKDNLHSNDKIIEEFDKLEHFKKVQERVRSASKGRHAKVKKNNELDKAQRRAFGEKKKEKRGRGYLNQNCDAQSNGLNYCDQDTLDRKKINKNDKNACMDVQKNERSCSKNSQKSNFAAQNNHLARFNEDNCDVLKEKCAEKKQKKCLDARDNECYVKKDRDAAREKVCKAKECDDWFY